MSDIRVVDAQNKPVEAPEPVEIGSSVQTGVYVPQIEDMAISQVLGIETDSERSKYKDDLNYIKDWAKSVGYDNPVELKMMVRELINRMGTSPMGESLITRVSRYAFLKLQESKIKEEQESLLQ